MLFLAALVFKKHESLFEVFLDSLPNVYQSTVNFAVKEQTMINKENNKIL